MRLVGSGEKLDVLWGTLRGLPKGQQGGGEKRKEVNVVQAPGKASGTYSTLSVVVQAVVLTSMLAYVVWQNSFLSEDWWYLPLRDIDDMAMNAATEEMRQAISEGAWSRVASFFAYAYGAGFYLLMAFVTSPAHIFESPQMQIIVGRNASLVAVFLTSLVVALIGRRVFPQYKHLWLVAVGFGFITPIALIDSTKMHVNGWSTLFGVIAIYLLVCEKRLTLRMLYFGAFVMGAAIGLKLTALTVLPVFAAVTLTRLVGHRVIHFFNVVGVVALGALLAGAPILLAYPIHPQGASQIIDPLMLFASMNAGDGGNNFSRVWTASGFYGTPLVLLGLLSVTVFLAYVTERFDLKSLTTVFPLSIVGTITVAWLLLALLVDKSAIYLATYALSITVLLPIGAYGLGVFHATRHRQLLLGWLLVCINLFWSPQFEGTVLTQQNYAAMASSYDIERRIAAAEDMSAIIHNVPAGTWVLQDSSSVFPISHIGTGVGISMLYGDFAARVATTPREFAFTYIVLDSLSYYGPPQPLEELARKNFREYRSFGDHNYELIYRENGTELYALVQSSSG